MRRFFNIYNTNIESSNSFQTIQNTREDIIGELEAIIQYDNHLKQTTDASAKETIQDIMMEEMLHVGQLFGLLFSLDNDSKVQFEKGLKEFKNE